MENHRYRENSKELNLKEKFWIKFFNTTNPEQGYNILEGGQTGIFPKELIVYAREQFMKTNGNNRQNVQRKESYSICNVETGELFKTYAEAGKSINVSGTHICEVVNGIHNSCGGFHWEKSNDLSCFENAFGCKELNTIYTSFNQALREDGFNANNLKKALNQSSPCVYAGYTFYWLNPQFH